MSLRLSVEKFSVALKESFKHHSADRKSTETVLVTVERNGKKGYGEGCPRSYVTGETLEGAVTWIESIHNEIEKFRDLNDLKIWQEKISGEINGNLAAFCATELALLDLFSKEQNETVEK